MLSISPIRIIPQCRQLSFKSNHEREAELSTIKALCNEADTYFASRPHWIELEIEAMKEYAKVEERVRVEGLKNQSAAMIKKIREQLPYPALDNKLSTKMAGFFAQFTCAIQNNSEHDIREFFGDDKTAAKLREKLSPECQHDSIELRNEIQRAAEIQDPVMMLIAANNMKKFMPKTGILSAEQQTNLVQGIKDVIALGIQNSDMSHLDEEDRYAISEMLQMIKTAKTTDFGISVKLKNLVDKLNKKKLGLGFIPPVKVKEIQTVVQKVVV